MKLRFRLNLLSMATVAAAIVLTAASSRAQSDATEEAVVNVVHELFAGMRAGDSLAVRNTFTEDATLVSTGMREGQPARSAVPIDRFIEAVGTPREEVWDERIWNIEVRVHDNLATVLTRFAFFLDDRFSHCGVNAFQLFQSSAGWKIFHIADTRRTEQAECEMPPEE